MVLVSSPPPRGALPPPAMRQCFYNESLSFFYNNSRKELSSSWRPKDLLVVALGLSVSAIVLLTNLLVIAAIALNRRFHHPIYYLLGNLAAADLFAGVAYMFLMFHTGPRTAELSLRTWFVRQSLLDTSLTASVVNLLAIAVERHQSVLAMQLHSRMSRQRVALLILGIWGTALLLGLIPSYGWHCLCALESCSSMAPLYSRSYLTFWALSNLLIFLVMLLVYGHIFLYVRRKMSRMCKHTNFHPRYRETMVSLVKTVTIVLGAFVVCWTPGQVVLLLDGLGCRSCDVLAVEKYILLLAEANSLLNAIIYSCRDREMRSTFRRLLCCLCRPRAAYAPAPAGLSPHRAAPSLQRAPHRPADGRALAQDGHCLSDGRALAHDGHFPADGRVLAQDGHCPADGRVLAHDGHCPADGWALAHDGHFPADGWALAHDGHCPADGWALAHDGHCPADGRVLAHDGHCPADGWALAHDGHCPADGWALAHGGHCPANGRVLAHGGHCPADGRGLAHDGHCPADGRGLAHDGHCPADGRGLAQDGHCPADGRALAHNGHSTADSSI